MSETATTTSSAAWGQRIIDARRGELAHLAVEQHRAKGRGYLRIEADGFRHGGARIGWCPPPGKAARDDEQRRLRQMVESYAPDAQMVIVAVGPAGGAAMDVYALGREGRTR